MNKRTDSPMTETKQQTLAELERLEKEATLGPWAYGPGEFHGGKRFEYVVGPRDVMVKFKAKPADLIAIVNGVGPLCEGNNADFIVALRNHALPLLREQGEEIERLRKALEEIAERGKPNECGSGDGGDFGHNLDDAHYCGACDGRAEAGEIARRALGGE
jgi:hypothetical protein